MIELSKAKNNVFIIEEDRVDKMDYIRHLLDHFTSEQFPIGKKTEVYWILRSDTRLNENNTQPTSIFNQLMFETQRAGFTDIMITIKNK